LNYYHIFFSFPELESIVFGIGIKLKQEVSWCPVLILHIMPIFLCMDGHLLSYIKWVFTGQQVSQKNPVEFSGISVAWCLFTA
jgi:hypothetical protein